MWLVTLPWARRFIVDASLRIRHLKREHFGKSPGNSMDFEMARGFWKAHHVKLPKATKKEKHGKNHEKRPPTGALFSNGPTDLRGSLVGATGPPANSAAAVRCSREPVFSSRYLGRGRQGATALTSEKGGWKRGRMRTLRWFLRAILVGGWATPLKNMKVNWDDYSQYVGK